MTTREQEPLETIAGYLADDHRRLDALLRSALTEPRVDPLLYDEFRAGLLRHIGMEEKILMPAAQRANNGTPLPVAARLRLDHGALAALLMLVPTPAITSMIQAILMEHNHLEERQGGAYALCEQLTTAEAQSVLTRLRSAPRVAVIPPSSHPNVLHAARRAVTRAGYAWSDEP